MPMETWVDQCCDIRLNRIYGFMEKGSNAYAFEPFFLSTTKIFPLISKITMIFKA